MSRTDVTIRPAEATDLDDIVRIDETLAGRTRKDYWQTRLDIAALRPPWMSLVAETDGRVVGF
ncbi:MAG TPA: GNAT family N-acetyltransferase, partial [Methylomirabilota bacterium]|nr:GNAT family N-acetyltransferase [Methylomirabilota bacterium]